MLDFEWRLYERLKLSNSSWIIVEFYRTTQTGFEPCLR